MTWRRRQRRRLLWAGVLLGLVLVVAATSLVRAGLWAAGELEDILSPSRRRDALNG